MNMDYSVKGHKPKFSPLDIGLELRTYDCEPNMLTPTPGNFKVLTVVRQRLYFIGAKIQNNGDNALILSRFYIYEE